MKQTQIALALAALLLAAACGTVAEGADAGDPAQADASLSDSDAGAASTADAAPGMVTLRIVRAGDGSVTSASGIDCGDVCSVNVAAGTTVTLNASVSSYANRFGGWTGGGCSGIPVCTLNVDADTTVTAQFEVFSASQLGQLAPGSPDATSEYGTATALSGSGDTAIVGAPNKVWQAVNMGVAYVLQRSAPGSWSQQAMLAPNNGVADDSFGRAIALTKDGSRALIGAVDQAYVFVRDQFDVWTQRARLVAPDGAAGFGGAVAMSDSGTTALVGASGAQAVWVFTRNSSGTWSPQARLTASDSTTFDTFGSSVSVSGDGSIAIVGAALHSGGGTASGAAYVFVRDTNGSWSQHSKLTASDAMSGAYFGRRVSISRTATIAVVGAPGNSTGAPGAAYVFEYDAGSWSQLDRLSASDGVVADLFGERVAMSGDGSTIVASARGSSSAGTGYVYHRAADGTWVEQATLTASTGAAGDLLGKGVGVNQVGDGIVLTGHGNGGTAYEFSAGFVAAP